MVDLGRLGREEMGQETKKRTDVEVSVGQRRALGERKCVGEERAREGGGREGRSYGRGGVSPSQVSQPVSTSVSQSVSYLVG